jgi:hypothetical protein
MRIPCPNCGTFNRLEGEAVRCAMCERLYSPTRLQVWKARREWEIRRWREACEPANLWGGLAVFCITVLLLTGMFAPVLAGTPVSWVCFWLFPFWTMTLVVGSLLIYRLDRVGALSGLRKCTAIVLGLLLLPFLYQSLPIKGWAKDLRTRVEAFPLGRQ